MPQVAETTLTVNEFGDLFQNYEIWKFVPYRNLHFQKYFVTMHCQTQLGFNRGDRKFGSRESAVYSLSPNVDDFIFPGVREVTKALAAKHHFVELVVIMAVPALCQTYAFAQRVLRDPPACRLCVGPLAGMTEIVSARESAAVHMDLQARDVRKKAAWLRV